MSSLSFPAPFIDFADHQRINLPIVLPDTPTSNEIEAAGMTASWAGMPFRLARRRISGLL